MIIHSSFDLVERRTCKNSGTILQLALRLLPFERFVIWSIWSSWWDDKNLILCTCIHRSCDGVIETNARWLIKKRKKKSSCETTSPLSWWLQKTKSEWSTIEAPFFPRLRRRCSTTYGIPIVYCKRLPLWFAVGHMSLSEKRTRMNRTNERKEWRQYQQQIIFRSVSSDHSKIFRQDDALIGGNIERFLF